MDYNKIYQNLIQKRKNNPIVEGYKENHHILPKSLGGNNSKENLVALTGREHWIAHLLLHKIHKLPQTVHACNVMAMRCEERGIRYIKNSKMYESIRIEHSKLMSKLGKQRIGDKNGSFGTMWICNNELKENKKIKKNEKIPEGWIKGRNKWGDVFYEKECLFCGKKFKTKKESTKYCSLKCSASNRVHSESARQKMKDKKLGKTRPKWVKDKISKTLKKNRYKNFN